MSFTSPGQEAKYQGPNGQLIIGTVILPPDLPVGQTSLLLPSITAVQGTFTGAISATSMVAGGVTSQGALVVPVTVVAATPYAVAAADVTVAVDSTIGVMTVNLPIVSAANGGRVLVFKKTTTDVNAVNVTPNGAQTIDGVNAAKVLAGAAVHALVLQSDGISNWIVWVSQ